MKTSQLHPYVNSNNSPKLARPFMNGDDVNYLQVIDSKLIVTNNIDEQILLSIGDGTCSDTDDSDTDTDTDTNITFNNLNIYNSDNSYYIVYDDNEIIHVLCYDHNFSFKWKCPIAISFIGYNLIIWNNSVYLYTYTDNLITLHLVNDDSCGLLQKFTTCKLKFIKCLMVLDSDLETVYITIVNADYEIYIATASISESQLQSLEGFVQLFTSTKTSTSTNTNTNIDMLYVNDGCYIIVDALDAIHICQISNIVTYNGETKCGNPSYHKIDKFHAFGELINDEQQNTYLSCCTYKDFIYIIYIAGTDQIRIVKLEQSYTGYQPVIIWSTRLNAINYYYEESDKITLMLGQSGNLCMYVSSGLTYVIREFIMDLGHTEGTVTNDAESISIMLDNIIENYASNSEQVTTPFISDIYEKNNFVVLRFENLNYNIISVYGGIMNELGQLIIETFTDLYDETYINIYDFSEPLKFEGSNDYILVYITRGTTHHPCVGRGTEVILYNPTTSKPEIEKIENINEGDLVINQLGNSVKVLEHQVSVIWTQTHNTPYIVPVNFFGENRPYRSLMISSNHGILLNTHNGDMKVIYAKDIPNLEKIDAGTIVEYHHLLLENHADNFFIANGLEVDSIHPGIFMKKR